MKDLDRELDLKRCLRSPVIERELWGEHRATALGGIFICPLQTRQGRNVFRVIASNGDGWDHVSVSLEHREPTWLEMEYVRKLFFKRHETVMQLHVPESDHISFADHCLHLWRPHDVAIPRPPAWMVGPKQGGDNHPADVEFTKADKLSTTVRMSFNDGINPGGFFGTKGK